MKTFKNTIFICLGLMLPVLDLNSQIITVDEGVRDNSIAYVCANHKVNLYGPDGNYSYLWSTGEQTKSIHVESQNSSKYFLTVTDKITGNRQKDSILFTFFEPQAESIGLVTFSEGGDEIIVAWERKIITPIKKYEIQRIEDGGSFWEKIGERDYKDSTYFVDRSSGILNSYYSYRLITIDSLCGTSKASPPHRPMYIQASLAADGVFLECKAYKGFENADYDILQYVGGRESVVANVPTYDGYDSYSYSVSNHPDQGSYRMSIQLEKEVNVSKLKTESGPFSYSISNIAEVELVTGFNAGRNKILMPIPVDNFLTVDLDVAYNLKIYSLTGLELETIGHGVESFNMSALPSGYYFCIVSAEGEVFTEQILKK